MNDNFITRLMMGANQNSMAPIQKLPVAQAPANMNMGVGIVSNNAIINALGKGTQYPALFNNFMQNYPNYPDPWVHTSTNQNQPFSSRYDAVTFLKNLENTSKAEKIEQFKTNTKVIKGGGSGSGGGKLPLLEILKKWPGPKFTM